MARRTTLVLLVFTALSLAGCIDTPRDKPLERSRTLAKRISTAKLEQIADTFLDQAVLADNLPRSRREQFVGAQRALARERIVAELKAAAVGSPQGDGLFRPGIKDLESVALFALLRQAMTDCKVLAPDAIDLITALETPAPVVPPPGPIAP